MKKTTLYDSGWMARFASESGYFGDRIDGATAEVDLKCYDSGICSTCALKKIIKETKEE
jgi:hypothetical protein